MSWHADPNLESMRYPSMICSWEMVRGIVRKETKSGETMYVSVPNFPALCAVLDAEKKERVRKEREEEEWERRERAPNA